MVLLSGQSRAFSEPIKDVVDGVSKVAQIATVEELPWAI
jgi:hypothetical protein